jgi:quinoprotein glucose dehydrogenase
MKRSATLLSLAACTFVPTHAAEINTHPQKANALQQAARASEPFLAKAEGKDESWRKSFKLRPGFASETWASEPLLSNPVAFTFDDQGRCFTSETNRYRSSVLDIRHYMFMLEDDMASRSVKDRIAYTKKNFPNEWQSLERETEIVRIVEDSKGLGRADTSRIFADGFNTILDGIASGILSHNGKVWFTNIPNLWLLEGIGPDGRAQRREALSHGWGVRFSYTGHDFHGLSLGPDGRLYFSIGDRGARIEDASGRPIIDLPDEGGVFRCEPNGANLELVMRGLRNPQETAFDELGNLFTADNDSDQGDRERFVYVVPGADAGWRVGWQHHPIGKRHNAWLAQSLWEPRDSSKKQPAQVLSPVMNIPDGPSGVAYYPGTGLPDEFRNRFFVCSFKGSTAKSAINSWSIKPVGAGFAVDKSPEEFVGNTQATDVEFGPDSRLYLSDWGSEGWESKGTGRIYRVQHESARQSQAQRIAEVQSLLKQGLSARPSQELATLLAHSDQRIRLRAQWTLSERSDAVSVFESVIRTSKERLPRLHAIWGLGQVARKNQKDGPGPLDTKSLAIFPSILGDSDAEIRANTLKVIGDCKARHLTQRGAIDPLLKDSEARVRFYAALAVGQTAAKESLPAVLEMIRENADKDQYLRHAAVMALSLANDKELLGISLTDPSLHVRLVTLLAMARTNDARISGFLKDSSQQIVSEAAWNITHGTLKTAQADLAKLVGRDGLTESTELQALNAAFRTGGDESATAIASFAANPTKPEDLRVEALTQLSLWAQPPKRDRVLGTFRPLPQRPSAPASTSLLPHLLSLLRDKEKVAIAACSAVNTLALKEAAPALTTLANDESAAAKVRVAALETLATLAPADFTATLTAALSSQSTSLRTAAAGLLAKRDPNAAAKQLMGAWSNSDGQRKKSIAETLGSVSSSDADKFLASLVDQLKSEPREAWLEILESAARQGPLSKAALARYESTLSKTDAVAKFLPTQFGGDRLSGERLFKEHAVAACMRCHRVGGTGGDAGPALDGFARTHDRNYVLESIVNVNAKIAPGFQMLSVTLKDGSTRAGLLKSENKESLSLQIPGGPTESIPLSNIAKRDNAPSGMIPNLGDMLSRRELRDIVEYVSSLR